MYGMYENVCVCLVFESLLYGVCCVLAKCIKSKLFGEMFCV